MGKISNFVSNHPIITGIVAYKVVDKIADKKSKQAVEEYKTEQQKQQQFESRQQEIIEEANQIQQRQVDPLSNEIITTNGKIVVLPHISDQPAQQSTTRESDLGIGGIFIGIIGIVVLIAVWRGISWLFGLFGC